MLDRLFQAFATHGKSSGTGLGLAICKKIIQDHQWRRLCQKRARGRRRFWLHLAHCQLRRPLMPRPRLPE